MGAFPASAINRKHIRGKNRGNTALATLNIIILAVIQGITEFLPISSSGHLAIAPKIFCWEDQGLLLDVAVHVGTLGAVLIYFWKDIGAMLSGLYQMFKGRKSKGARLVGLLIIASLPVIAAGYAVNEYLTFDLRGLKVIGWATFGFGIVLYIADKVGMTMRRIEHLGVLDALIIGFAQCLALIPGTSRSGITMAASRILGMERSDGARFSMLMSIPAILGAGSLKGYELYESGNEALTMQALTAAGLAFIAALITIALLMAWLKRASYTPFVIYRLLLGGLLLALAYGYIDFTICV